MVPLRCGLVALILASLVWPMLTEIGLQLNGMEVLDWRARTEQRLAGKTRGASEARGEGRRPRSASPAPSAAEPGLDARDTEIQRAIENIFQFPHDEPLPTNPPSRREGGSPACARGRGFCVGGAEGEEYPAEVVERLISEDSAKWSRFHGEDELTRVEQGVVDRGGGDGDHVELCRSRVSKQEVTRAQDADDKWLFVVQSPRLRQVVRVEVCEDPDAACDRLVSDGLAGSYRSSCRQKHVVREMLLLNHSASPGLYAGHVRLPSCCACVLHRRAPHDVHAYRSGGDVATSGCHWLAPSPVVALLALVLHAWP